MMSRFRLPAPLRNADSIRCAVRAAIIRRAWLSEPCRAGVFHVLACHGRVGAGRRRTAADGARGPGDHGTARLTTQSLKKTHLGRLPAFLAKQTLFATGFPATINDTLTTVSGRDVVFIDAAGQKVPSKPALSTAVQRLVTRILHVAPRVPA